ncbi:uncharacterized protein BYT42DRAFT_492900 [Radiomyces spectabilis]|uniref:uncharacterized protein n=1 Tax=Radiomyces spectabilis TaxID=64574 RepID=UPI002220F1C1|nr:uncharacterized protein BYT42DRAFT_492900 [Radiomyces spectabilis]KAI8385062.1 hypothetical protein BYT42DRAFT_492900 [Radiomyces spectabilis]
MNNDQWEIAVCKKHSIIDADSTDDAIYVYPGPTLEAAKELNYRELSALSPVKLMCQITRKKAITSGRMGHYELSGSMWAVHNYEFAKMAYEGTLGVFFQTGRVRDLCVTKIRRVWNILVGLNPLLRRYEEPEVAVNLIEYHLRVNNDRLGAPTGWSNRIALPPHDVAPATGDTGFEAGDLRIGHDSSDDIRFNHPSLMALLFPHLYTVGRGHYSMTVPTDENTRSTK